MQVKRTLAVTGVLEYDPELRFTSSSPRYRLALAFVTTAKENVVWQNCGYVWVM